MLARMDAIRARALLARAPGLSAEHLRALMLAAGGEPARAAQPHAAREVQLPPAARDRKSTRLNSSHDQISYAVFCLKKKKSIHQSSTRGRTRPGVSSGEPLMHTASWDPWYDRERFHLTSLRLFFSTDIFILSYHK